VIKLINALGQEKTLPITMHWRRVPLEIEVPSQPLHGRDGEVVTGKPRRRPRAFTLEGSIYHPNKSQIEQNADALLAFLMQMPVKVYRQHYHDRYLLAYPQGAAQDWLDAGAELQLKIPMVALDPYWYGPEVELTLSGTQTITVAGNAPAIPFIRTTGSASSLTVSNQTTGRQVVVSGASGVIGVDNVNHVVTIDGAERLDLVNDEWVLYGFELIPGDNLISTSAQITMTYRPRW